MSALTQDSPSYLFPAGIPAFETHTSFRLARDPKLDPLLFLVSGMDAGVRLPCIQARFLDADYAYELDGAEAAVLGVEPGRYTAVDERMACLAVLSVPDDGSPTANLMAPVVISYASGRGLQAIQMGGGWSHAHRIGGEEAEC
ncbi:MAG: flagellar assembly protein FliW [Bryobacteraceae bacterium]|nr:flagellar assembly protein FliW [Bryobacteraceae bacterium]